jgi:membrane protein DedA with SNARE-associated domain
MDVFLQDIGTFFFWSKYIALFLVTFFAAFALPLPSTVGVMAAAGFASQGQLSIGWVIFSAVLGNVLADNVLYVIIRFYGLSLFANFGLKITESSLLHFLTKHLDQHSQQIIFWSRFEPFSTITVNFLCGIAEINYRKFFWYVLFGEITQVLLFVAIGYFLGGWVIDIFSRLGSFSFAGALGTFLFMILFRKSLLSYLKKQSWYA